jgi:hypothetical protein
MSYNTGAAIKTKVYCKSGREIDNARIAKYEGFYRKVIKDFLPGLCLMEASMAYDDLLNQLRYEAFMALKNGFDPVKAMDSSIKDPEKRAKQIEKKLANPEKALEQAEKNIVYGRLVNYMRRSRWKYHPDQRGGRSVSLDAILTASSLNNDSDDNCVFFMIDHKNHIDYVQADQDRADLLKAMENGKDVKEMYLALPKERREDLLEILKNSTEVESFDVDDGVFLGEASEAPEVEELQSVD